VLILREVLGYSAAEAAAMLDTTPASVNSALQRARVAVAERVPGRSQQAELAQLGDEGVRVLVDEFVAAWERADLPALVGLLAEDAQFTMPPLPAWFDGRDSVRRFIAERVFVTPWRLVPLWANAQPGFACYLRQPGEDRFTLGAVNVLSIRDGLITRINGFLDPAMFARARVPNGWPGETLTTTDESGGSAVSLGPNSRSTD
jgi:RNA polymerase sigma-70 factor (ECF subfamily)